MKYLLLLVLVLAHACTCTPDKPVATIQPFFNTPGMVVKGFDEDCDKDIDYWQHYLNGRKVGRRSYVTD